MTQNGSLNLDGKHKTLICILIAIGAANIVLSTAWLGPAISSVHSEPNRVPVKESLHLQNQTVTRTGDNINISLMIVSTSPEGNAQVINRFEINHVEQRYVTGLEIYLNGTKKDSYYGFSYSLKQGDNLKVSLVVPSRNINPANQITLQVITPNAMYYKEMPFPSENLNTQKNSR